ncbi:MAG: GAF domain-containing protein [Anaerolineae bacterium]|nr:GAF domain-containing protein [Anaerolineae bacterium]
MSTILNNRYQVVRELGKGGMGAVYLVEDLLQEGRVVTLKMIRADLLGDRNLTQFKYEFAAQGQLNHPNLVTAYDFGVIADSNEYFYTMEYIPGEDLYAAAQRLSQATPGVYDWLYDIVVQTCRALQYIHSRGLIHYDVKPGNIRITPEGQVKLMDFGLIGEARGEGQIKVRGTPEYIAPELVRGDPVDHRADLYSLGISLYEIVAGKLPFSGDSSMVILRQHVEATPEPPRKFSADVPEALQSIILRLIAKEPADRYESANAVIQAVNRLAEFDFPVETKETKRGYVQSGSFVGREFELARLQGLMMRMMQEQGRLVLITGAAGMGKTRLVRELRLRAQMQRVLVCEGTCREQVRTPYRPWVSILSQVIAHHRSSSPDVLQVYGMSLVRLIPELADQVGVSPLAGAEIDDKQALFDAAYRFLSACDRPLMLIVEDLQYADAETVELLDYLGQRAAQVRWLLCGVYREHGMDEAHPLNALVAKARLISRRHESQPSTSAGEETSYDLVHLEALSEIDTKELVQSMLGVKELPPGLLTHLIAQTGGNPLFIESMMHNMVEEDLLRYDGEAWQIDVTGLKRIPQSIQEASERRLHRLDEESLALLQWAAAMGQWPDMEVLARVTDHSPEDLYRIVNDAVQRHVLAAGEQDGESTYRFITDSMRDAIYNTLSPEERTLRHRQIGEVMCALYEKDQVAEWLAWHFEQAGDFHLALRHAQIAGDKARQASANESAIQHYGRALSFMRQRAELADSQVEYEILSGREDCYRLVGERRAQQADLDRMAQLAEEMNDFGKRIEVATRQVALANDLGNHVDARHAAEEALALARQVQDQKLEADSLNALSDACIVLGERSRAQECYEQALRLYRDLGDRRGEALSLEGLGTVARRAGYPSEAMDYFERALAIHRETGNRQGEADALNALGITTGDRSWARNYHEQSLGIAQSMGNRADQARSYNNLAIAYWSLGLYGRARDYMEQAVQIVRDMGGRSSLAHYLETLGRTYLELGEYVQAQQVLEEGRAISTDIGDRYVASAYWYMLGRVALARRQLPEARELIQAAADMQREMGVPDLLSTSLAWLGATYLEMGDWAAAHECTAEAIVHREAAGDSGEYPSQDVWWLHYQILKAAPGRAANDPIDDEAWEILQRTRDAMMAGIATLSDEGLRRNYLNKVRTNRDIITEWTRQASIRAAGPETPPEILLAPEVEFAVTGEAELVQDRLKRVLDISVQMNETREVDMLLNYVMDQVIELSGAERGFLVLVDEAGRMNFQVARGIDRDEIEHARSDISYTVIGSVAQSRAPVLLQDALADERFGRQSSVLELNLRSVLCVPLVTRAELIGMIYADNRSVSGRFSQTDLDLMTIFANQAAIAIENARLYEETVRANIELEAWAHTLEQRVAERTAELQTANAALSERALQLETSSEVGQQVTSILDLDSLLTQVVDLIQARFGYYFVGVWLVEEGKKSVVLHAGTDQVDEILSKQDFYIPLDASSIIASVCRQGEYRLVDDVRGAADYMQLDVLPDAVSELAVPLRMGALTIGALDIVSNKLAAFGDDDRMVLQTLAAQIAIAIRNAQLYRAERQRRQLAESLEQIGRALSSSLELGEVSGRILEQLDAVVPYERGSVLLQQGDMLVDVARRGFPDVEHKIDLRVPIRRDSDDVFQRMIQTRRPVLLDDVTSDPGWQQLEWLPVNRSWIGVPLISKDRVIGMISLTRTEAAAFTPDDVQVVLTFAGQAAIALENASLYDEITRFNEQLEQMVQQRTEELNRAYRTLEQLDKTKTDFIDVAAHELRTPLTVVIGYAQVLESNSAVREDQNTTTLLKGIREGGKRLHEIVNSMLDAAKIDTQALRAHREPVILSAIMGYVRKEYQEALEERNLALAVVGIDELPTIQADPNLLKKVFVHLVGNAIKFTPDGGTITIGGRVVFETEAEPAVELVVSDTGIGIDPEHHELIFEKFYQTGEVSLHSSGRTKFKGGGPGLGLAIVKGIVLAHDGQIWVESAGCDEEKCPGSQFYVRLPIVPP